MFRTTRQTSYERCFTEFHDCQRLCCC